ncbi:hypothetical protein C0992_002081 [Termitomyces sp. T32_za158]|nr:hypothetical protein C0992_002081 [Termitomyces sp. T32_za158]
MLQLAARILSSTAAFVYPAYASYKSLSQRPAAEADLERWLMYWSVLGCIVGIELLAEWLLAWIPLYYTIKSIFLLYLVLPQTQGATYIYTAHLRPFFRAHEAQIDAALAQLRARAVRFVQERLRALWAALAQPQPQGTQGARSQSSQQDAPLAPLWRAYAARLVASVATSFAAGPGSTQDPPDPDTDIAERRRRLQAELAALDRVRVRGPRERTDSGSRSGSGEGSGEGGRFEEVEVPSDVEGYDVGSGSGSGGDGGAGGETAGERGERQGSWFAWPARRGYERVKSE